MSGQIKLRVIVWLALMALLTLTVSLTFVPLGPWRLPASLAIAAAKTGLIAWVFMELRTAAATVRLVVAAVAVMLFALIALSSLDVMARMSLAP